MLSLRLSSALLALLVVTDAFTPQKLAVQRQASSVLPMVRQYCPREGPFQLEGEKRIFRLVDVKFRDDRVVLSPDYRSVWDVRCGLCQSPLTPPNLAFCAPFFYQ
jgi:hypothetical protein